jgi:hypothetical protein
MPAMQGINARDLAHELALRAEDLFRLAIPDAKQSGGLELRGHAPDGGVVSMALRGRKRGRWSNWQDENQRGDCLDFVTHMLTNGSASAAYRWSINWLGGSIMPARNASPVKRMASHFDSTSLSRVRWLWNGADPNYRDPIASYLANRLGSMELDPPEIFPALRYDSNCFHSRDHGSLPAMLAAMFSLEHGQHIATHVTYLEQRNDGWHKSRCLPPRKIWGSYTNAVIPLIGHPRDLTKGERVLVGEGIENTLAGNRYLESEPPAHVWAAASLGNLTVLTPKAPVIVTLVRDNDAGNDAATRMFDRAVAHLTDLGCDVDVIAAPPGFADLADYLLQQSIDG